MPRKGQCKITIEDLCNVPKEHDGYCLSTNYIPREKSEWKCNKPEHLSWFALYHNIKKGIWCPYCAGTNKRTIEFAHELAKSRDGYCLEDVYINNATDMEWKCKSVYHISWFAPSHRIVSGSWCPECAIEEQRYSLKDARELAHTHDGYCLSVSYENGKDNFEWKCNNIKHISWFAGYYRISKGQWCKECYKEEFHKKQLNKLLKYLEENKCTLESEYKNIKTKINIRCEYKHPFSIYPFRSCICPECTKIAGINYENIINKSQSAIKINKLKVSDRAFTIEMAHYLAKKHNGKCTSTSCKNSKEILGWKCEFGHPFEKPIRSVKRGHWCPECKTIKKDKKRLDRIAKLVENRGGKIVSYHKDGWNLFLRIECDEHHFWDANSKTVLYHWCPECNCSGKIVREKLLSIFPQIFPAYTIKTNQRTFPWLIGPGGGRMEIDYVFYDQNNKIVLGIEYDGKQHFELVNFAGDIEESKKEFELVKQRDKMKNKLISEHEDKIPLFLRIPHTLKITYENIYYHVLGFMISKQVPIDNFPAFKSQLLLTSPQIINNSSQIMV